MIDNVGSNINYAKMKDVLTLKFNLNDKPSNGTISKILKEINFTHKKIKLRKKAYY